MSEQSNPKDNHPLPNPPPPRSGLPLRFFSPAGEGIKIGFLFAVLVFAADQASKILLRLFVVPDEWSKVIILPIFNLVHAWNLGASFSLFAAEGEARRWTLILMMLVISGFVVAWLLKTTRKLPALAYGAILGGALGNVADRVWHGAVFDFLQFHLAGYYYPSFNLADSAIVVGVGVVVLDSFRQETSAS